MMLPIMLLVLLLAGCTKEKIQQKSMSELHRENGIPVKTIEIKAQEFSTFVTYFADLKGIEESIAGAPIDEKIESVRVKTGDMVNKGQVLVTLPINSPASQYRQAEAAYQSSKTVLERIDGLYKVGGISLQERDNAQTRFDVARANWQAVRQTIRVEAPISGMVTRVYVNPSDNVKAKSPLVSIAKINRLKAELWVSEADVEQIRTGKAAIIEWLDKRSPGTVTQMDLAMNQQLHGFRTVVEIDNADGRFRPGVTARVLLITYHSPSAIVVKRKHIFSEGGQNQVYLDRNGTAHKQAVTLGQSSGMDVEVTSGLSIGDRLISEGILLLSDGAKIRQS
jgi:RND family efflux transporter MFP subunit